MPLDVFAEEIKFYELGEVATNKFRYAGLPSQHDFETVLNFRHGHLNSGCCRTVDRN